MKRFAWVAAGACVLAVEARASAQATTPEPTPSYTIDGAQGPVTGSTRVIGLGGAFVAIAEGMDGVAVNPASVAVRSQYSWNKWDTGFGLHFAIGSWLPKSNFLNQRGSNQSSDESDEQADVDQRSLLFGSVGLTINYEYAGFGISAEGQRQALRRSADTEAGLKPTNLSGNFGLIHSSLAYGFGQGQLVVGAGPRVTGVSLSRSSSASGLLSVAGIGYQVGAIFKPADQQFRVGAEYKSPVTPSLSADNGEDPTVYEATAIRLPWQASIGFAYQFGRRPLNPRFFAAEDQPMTLRAQLEEGKEARDRELEHAKQAQKRAPTLESRRLVAHIEQRNDAADDADERLLADAQKQAERALKKEYFSRPRFYVLVTTELLALGASTDSVGFGSYYQGRSTIEAAGRSITLSPRIGIETEAVPNWLKLRAGSYLEPARVSGATDRIHGTFGFEAKLFRWNVFGLIGDFDSWTASAAIDGAREYLSTSFSVGFWH